MSYRTQAEFDDDWVTLTPAMHDVIEERVRQIRSEGWSAEHDDAHVQGELATAAVCYATNAITRARLKQEGLPTERIDALSDAAAQPRMWPWSREWWKPRGQRRNLVKAAALILAEIDRIDRATAKAGGQ